MTDPNFLPAAKRALERLNPRMLSCGDLVNKTKEAGCTVCAMGAYLVAERSKKRVEPNAFRRYTKHGWAMGCGILIMQNENFRPGDNSVKAQRARWKHVHAWLRAELKKPQPIREVA